MVAQLPAEMAEAKDTIDSQHNSKAAATTGSTSDSCMDKKTFLNPHPAVSRDEHVDEDSTTFITALPSLQANLNHAESAKARPDKSRQQVQKAAFLRGSASAPVLKNAPKARQRSPEQSRSSHALQLSTASSPAKSLPPLCDSSLQISLTEFGSPNIIAGYRRAPNARFPAERRATERSDPPFARATLVGNYYTLPGPYSSILSPGPGQYGGECALGARQNTSSMLCHARYSFASPKGLPPVPRRRHGPLFTPTLSRKQWNAVQSQYDEAIDSGIESLRRRRAEWEHEMSKTMAQLNGTWQRTVAAGEAGEKPASKQPEENGPTGHVSFPERLTDSATE